jgi:hypothetical protein
MYLTWEPGAGKPAGQSLLTAATERQNMATKFPIAAETNVRDNWACAGATCRKPRHAFRFGWRRRSKRKVKRKGSRGSPGAIKD